MKAESYTVLMPINKGIGRNIDKIYQDMGPFCLVKCVWHGRDTFLQTTLLAIEMC